MKFFVFIVLIPVIAGVISSMCGLGVTEEPKIYFMINLPICAISSLLWSLSE